MLGQCLLTEAGFLPKSLEIAGQACRYIVIHVDRLAQLRGRLNPLPDRGQSTILLTGTTSSQALSCAS